MKTAASILLLILSVIVTILVLIHGWGLEVKSWGWIAFGAIFNLTVLIIAIALEKSND